MSECRCFVDPNLIKSKRYCEFGDLLISDVSENQQDVGKAIVYLGNERPIVGSHICVIKHSQNPKFLAYIFSTKYIRNQIKKLSTPSTVFGLSYKNIKRIKIPLPSLEEQGRMVDILDQIKDNCESLEANIKKLIEFRSKQYNFYSEMILSQKSWVLLN